MKELVMDNQIDTKVIDKLAAALNKNNLSELEYENEKEMAHFGRQRLRSSRGDS